MNSLAAVSGEPISGDGLRVRRPSHREKAASGGVSTVSTMGVMEINCSAAAKLSPRLNKPPAACASS